MSRPATPAWLLRPEAGLCACRPGGRRRRGGFLAGTLEDAAGVLQQALANEELAGSRGLVQRLDPRVKLVTLVGLLVAVGLVRHVGVLVAVYALTVVLAAVSGVPLSIFLRRVWIFVPVFTGIVVLPATFSFVTPGEIVVPLGHWFGDPVGLTRQGLVGAVLVVLRVATSISLVVLLTLTTPWPRLLAALRALFVPRLLVLVIGMAYRYLFVLLAAAAEMAVARRARAIDVAGGAKQGRAFAAATAGALFGKAHALGEEIHQAMLARGYRGDARPLQRFRLELVDGAWTLAVLALAALALGVDRVLGV